MTERTQYAYLTYLKREKNPFETASVVLSFPDYNLQDILAKNWDIEDIYVLGHLSSLDFANGRKSAPIMVGKVTVHVVPVVPGNCFQGGTVFASTTVIWLVTAAPLGERGALPG